MAEEWRRRKQRQETRDKKKRREQEVRLSRIGLAAATDENSVSLGSTLDETARAPANTLQKKTFIYFSTQEDMTSHSTCVAGWDDNFE